MKKIVLSMIVAAAALVGCQKSEDFATGKTISLSAEMSQPETGRTALVENEGVYSAIWKSGDKLTLFELADNAYTLYESNALTADAATASFTFDGVAAKEAASFRYVAGTNITSSTTVANLRVELPSAQAPATMTTFDGAADILLSRPIDRESQPVSEALTFSTARVSAVVKLMIKNLALVDGEKVEKVVFGCEQPISGLFQVGVDDLEEGKYPVPFSWRKEGYSVSITLPEAQSGDFATYFSCLPATLKAGETYQVQLQFKSGATLTKMGKLAADLELKAGDITSLTVNMGDAATKSKVENLSEEYTYAIGYTKDGVTYLLNRSAVTRNPAGAALSTLDLSLDAKGSISGAVPEAYVWNFEKGADGKVKFYYMTGSGNKAHLIGGDKTQGVAIQSKNADGVYAGQYYAQGVSYDDAFVVEEKEGGYCLNVAGNRWLDYTGTAFIANTKEDASGVVNFYRVQKAAVATEPSLYPVIKVAALVSEGTYVLLFRAPGEDESQDKYYAMKNDMTLTTPAAIPADQVSLKIEDGSVVEANVAKEYQWILTSHPGYYIFRSAVDKERMLWKKDNGGNYAIATQDEFTNASLSGRWDKNWTFLDSAYGLQARLVNYERYLSVNANLFWYGGGANFVGSIVLVKLSDSTDVVTE